MSGYSNRPFKGFPILTNALPKRVLDQQTWVFYQETSRNMGQIWDTPSCILVWLALFVMVKTAFLMVQIP